MSSLYRYTSNGLSVWSAGKRLLPPNLSEEFDRNSEWLIKQKFSEGNYRYYLTEEGNVIYRKTLFNTHKKYLQGIRSETVQRENIELVGTIAFEDEYQVIVQKREPQFIKDIDFDFSWSPEKVWALDLPTEDMAIKDLEWQLDIPFWSSRGGYYDVVPRDVWEHKELHKEEYERVMAADISHPIDIMFSKGRWALLDGLHRLLKLKMQGATKVRVRKVGLEYIPQIKS